MVPIGVISVLKAAGCGKIGLALKSMVWSLSSQLSGWHAWLFVSTVAWIDDLWPRMYVCWPMELSEWHIINPITQKNGKKERRRMVWYHQGSTSKSHLPFEWGPSMRAGKLGLYEELIRTSHVVQDYLIKFCKHQRVTCICTSVGLLD